MVNSQRGASTGDSSTDSVSSNRRRFLKITGAVALTGTAGCQGNGTDTEEGGGGTPTDTDAGNGGATSTRTSTDIESSGGQLPDTLHIGVPSPTEPVYSFPLYGQFQQELGNRGVTLERTFFQGFTPMVAGLVRGEVDIGYLTISAAVQALNSGFPITSPVSYLNEYVFVMVVDSEIESWSDLEGKSVATHSPQSMSTAVGATMVTEELGGTDAVELANILGATQRLAAIESGNVSAAIVPLSAGLNAEQEEYARVFARPWEYDSLRNQTAATWIVLEDQLDEEEAMYGEVYSMLTDSYKFVYDADVSDFTGGTLKRGGDVFPGYGQEIWEQSFTEVRDIDTWPADGQFTAEQINRAQSTMTSSGMISEDEQIDPRQLMDDRFW